MTRIVTTLAALASVSLLAASAAAEERGLPAPSEATNAYLHDGFYLRMALGGGGLVSRDHVNGATGGDATLTGGGVATEVSIGGSPRPGLVLAGTLLAQSTELGKVSDGAGSSTLRKRLDFVMLGATLDLFPDPSSGFHLTSTLGPAFMSSVEDDRVRRRWHSHLGGSLSVAAGYDWWIAPQWSMGFLVRATAARLYGTAVSDDATSSASDPPPNERNVAMISASLTVLLY